MFITVPPTVTDYSPTGTELEMVNSIYVSFSTLMNNDSVDISVPGYSGTIAWSAEGATLMLDDYLAVSTEYMVTITGEDEVGVEMEPFSWTFTTADHIVVECVIVDSDGNPVPVAEVTVNGQNVSTDEKGRYVLRLIPGTHSLNLEAGEYWGTTVDVDIGGEGYQELAPITMDEMNLTGIVLVFATFFFTLGLAMRTTLKR